MPNHSYLLLAGPSSDNHFVDAVGPPCGIELELRGVVENRKLSAASVRLLKLYAPHSDENHDFRQLNLCTILKTNTLLLFWDVRCMSSLSEWDKSSLTSGQQICGACARTERILWTFLNLSA